MIQGIYYNGNDPVIDVGELPPEVICGRFSGPLADPDPAERIYRAILEGQGDFEELVKVPFLLHQMGAALVSDIIGKALGETNGNYRMALRLLRVPDRRYTSTLQFLKRNGCYLPYGPFRKKGGSGDDDS